MAASTSSNCEPSSESIAADTDPGWPPADHITNHIIGLYDSSFVEQDGQRYERNFTWTAEGELETLTAKNEWEAASTDFTDPENPAASDNVDPDSDDLVSTSAYDARGNLESITFTGGDDYPDQTPSHTYVASYTTKFGRAIKLELAGLSYPTSEIDVDVAGYITESIDPNGLVTTLSYDSLGRLTEIDPPGADEYPTSVLHPSLTELRVIQSDDPTDSDYEAGEPEQIYSAQIYDGLGRLIEAWKAMPDDTQSVQVTRYDPMGRVVFVSEWINETDYNNAPKIDWDVDLDGDSVADYSVEVPGKSETEPWGTTTYYGTPSGQNPFLASADPLGKAREVIKADGSRVTTDYCGPHEIVTVHEACGGTCDATTRYYSDALGRLAVVDTEALGADAEYRYDARGQLERVNLFDDADLPQEPFEIWVGNESGSFTDGQIRTFNYDATGRLKDATSPEDGTTIYNSYDVWGNLLTYQDALATERGYFFRNTYDVAGRLVTTEKVRGTPASPSPTDDPRLGSVDGTFETLTGWESGTFDGSGDFATGSSYWTQGAYSLPCLDAPPSGGGSYGLYLGYSCRYMTLDATPQVQRAYLTNIDPDDVVTFKFWRLLREGGAGDKDVFTVYAGDESEANVSNLTRLFRLSDAQASHAKWRHTPAMRLGDFFDESAWPSAIYLYFVFEKGDAQSSGLGVGMLVDDLFVGRRGAETLAQYTYDEDACSPLTAGEACASGVTNHPYGKLTGLASYHDGRLIADKALVYQGLNGRLSGEQHLIDWTGVGESDEWVVLHDYENHGLPSRRPSAYLPGVEADRVYSVSYSRGLLDDLQHSGPLPAAFLSVVGPGVEYNAAGGLYKLSYANGTSTTIDPDSMYRPASIQVDGPDGSGGIENLWHSQSYLYDGAGNIKSIGPQTFTYDKHDRLVGAVVQGHAQKLGTSLTVGYAYDIYGNMITRTWDDGIPETGPPAGFEITHMHTDNRIDGPNFAYDPNGNLTELTSAVSTEEQAFWDAQNRMLAYARAGTPAERYLYDADGYRIVRYPDGGAYGDGEPVITIRSGDGTPISEYVAKPGSFEPELSKDFVHGAGQLLVEREVVHTTQVIRSSQYFYDNGAYGFEIVSGDDGGPYTVDIRTESGYSAMLSGITLDVNGEFWVDESYFSTTEPSFLRVKSEAAEAAAYSAPVSLMIDPSVDATSENPINAMSVSRVGNDVIIRWKLFSPLSEVTNLYYNEQGEPLQSLTTTPLLPGVKTYTVEAQSMAVSCVDLRATFGTGQNETVESLGTPLTSTGNSIVENVPPCQEPPPSSNYYIFADSFHHRDHLGNLRMVTDAGGWQVSAHDYYPFGTEIVGGIPDVTGGSRMRFTGHERDEETQLDYMKARYCGANLARFLAVDPVQGAPRTPQSWNRYAYVRNNPLRLVDPTGLDSEDHDDQMAPSHVTESGIPSGSTGSNESDGSVTVVQENGNEKESSDPGDGTNDDEVGGTAPNGETEGEEPSLVDRLLDHMLHTAKQNLGLEPFPVDENGLPVVLEAGVPKAISGKALVKMVQKLGGKVTGRGKGSHVVVELNGRTASIPVHGNKDLGTGLRRAILKQLRLD